LTDRSELRLRIVREREKLASGRRDASDPHSLESLSARVVENLGRRLKDLEDRVIASYRVIPGNPDGEVDLAFLPAEANLLRSHVAYPRILDRIEKRMDFAIPIHESDWVRGPFGIPQPRLDLPALRAEEIDVVLVPGVVFGRNGERLGRGAGYYDRFFSEAPEPFRIGIAFDFQVVSEAIPQESWDARMNALVTESRVLEISKKT
jgi:5,10-methenyltetrahydrofolate synthetase